LSQHICLSQHIATVLGNQLEMPPAPGEILIEVDKWVVDTLINSTATNLNCYLKNKKDWNDSFLKKSRKLSNADEGATLAGELFHLVQISRYAMNQYEDVIKNQQIQISKLKDLKEGATVETFDSLKSFITSEIHSIVPTFMGEMESKLKKIEEKEEPANLARLISLLEKRDAVTTEDEVAPKVDVIKHKLFIENENESDKITDESWANITKKDLEEKLKDFQVSGSYVNSKGGATVLFPTDEIRDKAADILHHEYKVITKSESDKKLSPKIKLLNLPPEIFGDSEDADTEHNNDIVRHIASKNQSLKALIDQEEKFKIVHKKKKEGIIIIDTTTKIRQAIKDKRNRLFIGLQSIQVRDHVHLDQCYHCQAFGHYADSCNLKLKDGHGSCFYCSSKEHTSKNCPNKKTTSEHRCINCMRQGKSLTHHKATDPLCPNVIKETLRIYSRTEGMDPHSKNSYLAMLDRIRSRRRLN